MKRFLKLLGVVIAMLLGVSLFWEPLAATRYEAPDALKHDARIVRDGYGVPHVFGKTDADTAFGLAYAHAEDDFETIEEVLAMSRGRYGALIGQKGVKVDYVFHLLGARQTAERDYPDLPADVKAMVDGYARGINLYAARHPGEVRLKRLFPANGADIMAGFVLRSPFFYGLDDTLGELIKGKEPAPQDVETMTPAGSNPSMNGSNAFAVAPGKMADGKTWLISNSHQPYEGNVAWYEASVHSGEGLDMAGALFPGSPFVLLGHNRNLGWTNTVNQPDLIDVYRLNVNPGGDQYRMDGKWKPLSAKRVWLPVKFGPFTIPIPRTIQSSEHGPVISNEKGSFAIRYAGIDQSRMLEQYYRITKAQNWEEWTKAMSLGGVTATNFIYADKTGRIAYIYYGLFPPRKPGFDYAGILPGDTSASLWSGSVPFSQMPKVLNPESGWVINANNTPFQAAGPGSEMKPGDWSPLLGIERRTTNRMVRLIELLSAEKGQITPERLLEIKFDKAYSRNGFAGRWMEKLLAADLKDAPDLAAAQSLLKQWDWTSDGSGKADALGEGMMHMAHRAAYRGEQLPDAREKLREIVDALNKGFGRIDAPLADVQRLRRGKADMAMFGGTDTVRAATIWDPQPDGRMRVKHGDSFTMLVTWDKSGRVSSQSVQPYGSATNRPNSPHYTDQMKLFVEERFKPVPFERQDLLKQARRAYRVQ